MQKIFRKDIDIFNCVSYNINGENMDDVTEF